MEIQVKYDGDLAGLSAEVRKRLGEAAAAARDIIGTRAKLSLRQEIRSSGLGERLATTWRFQAYGHGRSSPLNPVALVFSKAPKIVTAFSANTVITPKGTYLAIPTENTPRRGNRYMKPNEVEEKFQQSLVLIHGRGQQILVFVDAIKGKSGKGYRRASKKRIASGREVEMVLMYVFVRQVHLKKRLNWPTIIAGFEAEWPNVMAQQIAQALE